MARQGSNEWPPMIRGSVVTQRRRCGKPNCRCVDGEQLHEASALSYSAGGRNRTIMLGADELAAVSAAVRRYRTAKSELESAGEAGLSALLTRRARARRGR